MLEVATAKAWRMSPSQFKSLSDEDIAYMIALEETNSQIASADAFIAEENAKKEQRKSQSRTSRRGRNR